VAHLFSILNTYPALTNTSCHYGPWLLPWLALKLTTEHNIMIQLLRYTIYRTQHNDTVTTLHYIVFCFIYFLLVSCCSILCKQTFYELWTNVHLVFACYANKVSIL